MQASMLRRQLWLLLAAGGAVVLLAAPSGSSTRTRAPTRRAKVVVASTTTTTAGPFMYQVKRGDNLTALARFFGLSPSDIITFNHLGSADQLTVGQILQIPRRAPAQLVVTPRDGSPGETFTFNLTGAEAGETVTFEIDGPGYKFTGPPHTAAEDGSVTASYQTNGNDASGVYTVGATGDQGTTTRATLRIDASSPIS
jgi:LysM repeat protein